MKGGTLSGGRSVSGKRHVLDTGNFLFCYVGNVFVLQYFAFNKVVRFVFVKDVYDRGGNEFSVLLGEGGGFEGGQGLSFGPGFSWPGGYSWDEDDLVGIIDDDVLTIILVYWPTVLYLERVFGVIKLLDKGNTVAGPASRPF